APQKINSAATRQQVGLDRLCAGRPFHSCSLLQTHYAVTKITEWRLRGANIDLLIKANRPADQSGGKNKQIRLFANYDPSRDVRAACGGTEKTESRARCARSRPPRSTNSLGSSRARPPRSSPPAPARSRRGARPTAPR